MVISVLCNPKCVFKEIQCKTTYIWQTKRRRDGGKSLFEYIENFTTKKMKSSGSVHISTQKIDCAYLLEPPRQK